MSNQPVEAVSEEELAFLEASVEFDRMWDELIHMVRSNTPPAAIETFINLKLIEQEHLKHSRYRCWKENHPKRYETGSHRLVGGEDIDDTREVCADCGRTIKPRSTPVNEIPGNETPDIPF